MAVILLCFSCGPKQVSPPSVDWDFQSGGIEISYEAAADLNQYNNSSHTLMLVVYQLSDASDFKDYIRTADGVKRLLQLYDLDQRKTVSLKNLVDLQSFIISPGSEKTLKIDREENAQWVGLVAGYFSIVPERCSAVFQIPVVETKKGFIKKKIEASPGDLTIDLDLGAHSIHTIRDKQ